MPFPVLVLVLGHSLSLSLTPVPPHPRKASTPYTPGRARVAPVLVSAFHATPSSVRLITWSGASHAGTWSYLSSHSLQHTNVECFKKNWQCFKTQVLLFRYGQANRAEDSCHWEDSLLLTVLMRKGQGAPGGLEVGERGTAGGQAPLLRLPWKEQGRWGRRLSVGYFADGSASGTQGCS